MDTERKAISMSKSESIKNYSLSLDSQFLGTSLNKANQQERRVEKFLISRQYDEAIKCHKKASEYLLEALETSKNMETRQLLQLKYDYHKKQPALLKETQRKAKQRKQLLIEMSENEKKDINENNVDVASDNTDNGSKDVYLLEERNDSVENADSLLHILQQNSKEENGNITFRTPSFFNQIKANLASLTLTKGKFREEVLTEKMCSKRPGFEKEKIIHDLQVTIMTLVKDLYSCEEENKYLKCKVDTLQGKLETSECRDTVGNKGSPLLEPLSTLFSTDFVDSDDTLNLDDNFQPHSLQPLPGIDMPEM